MFSLRLFNCLIVFLFLFTPLGGRSVVAQVATAYSITDGGIVEYHKLELRNLANIPGSTDTSRPFELVFSPLTSVENDMARNLNSHWIWSESTLNIIDSYSPFLFRTKKSAKIEEVKVLLQVNSVGRLSGFELLSEVDKGLRERIDFVLRKLSDCKPVPGYDSYGFETFELIIKK